MSTCCASLKAGGECGGITLNSPIVLSGIGGQQEALRGAAEKVDVLCG